MNTDDKQPGFTMPRVIPGMAFNPREQMRAFDWNELGIIPVSNVPTILLPHNPCRFSFTIEYLSGDQNVNIYIGDYPTAVATSLVKIGSTLQPFCLSCWEFPGLPQNQWTIVSATNTMIRVYEMVARF